ncbi:MAG: sigma-70 family RNA polymerase sigma factor [Deltaproteobacteria bacterium]|nr:sigma-70 family RNA polymerase sigma factor [Deltaproteobacteria bacterium]
MSYTLQNAKEAGSLVFPWGKGHATREEFERLTLPYFGRLYSGAYYFTKNEALAEELVHDTYLRAFRYFDKFERGTNCKAWLLSIMRNIFINRYRRTKRQPKIIDWDVIDETYESIIVDHQSSTDRIPEALLFSQCMDSEVETALKDLTEEFRSALVLVDIQELSYEEAAKVMECPVGTVRSRLSRGRRLLQVALRDFAPQRGLLKK